MPISTSSRSGSTVASPAAEASCSTGCWNRPSPSSRFPTNPSSNALQTQRSKTTSCWGHLSHVNTHLQIFNAVDVRPSETATSFSNPNSFNTTTLNLTCNASPITATISGPLMNSSQSAPLLTQ